VISNIRRRRRIVLVSELNLLPIDGSIRRQFLVDPNPILPKHRRGLQRTIIVIEFCVTRDKSRQRRQFRQRRESEFDLRRILPHHLRHLTNESRRANHQIIRRQQQAHEKSSNQDQARARSIEMCLEKTRRRDPDDPPMPFGKTIR
jgi:hypothetical protein